MKKGEKMSAAQKRKIGHSNFGKRRSIEQKKNISKSLTGRKLSKQHIENVRQGHRGVRNYLWKGTKVGYRALHIWVQTWLGKPRFCEKCKRIDYPKRYYHWANRSGKYLRRLSDWIRLCAKCHGLFDKRKRYARK